MGGLRNRGSRAGEASKHPVAWVVIYAPVPPDDAVIEGGELFVAVDLESGTVGLRTA